MQVHLHRTLQLRGAVCAKSKMSAQGTINVVDDEEMSSEGSVNTPVLPQQQGAVAQAPDAANAVNDYLRWPSPTEGCSDPTIGRCGSQR